MYSSRKRKKERKTGKENRSRENRPWFTCSLNSRYRCYPDNCLLIENGEGAHYVRWSQTGSNDVRNWRAVPSALLPGHASALAKALLNDLVL